MEYEPYGGRQIRMTASERRKMRKKIIKGGKVADQIRKMAADHHEEHEIPSAEKEIDTSLQSFGNSNTEKINAITIEKTSEKKKSFWEKLLRILKRLLIP